MEPYNIQRTRAAGPTKPISLHPVLGIRCIEPSESHQAAGVAPPMLGVYRVMVTEAAQGFSVLAGPRPPAGVAATVIGTPEQSELKDQSMHETIPDDSCTLAPDVLDRKEVLSLLTQRMAELPDTPKRVLAMYYHENMRLSEIASCFRLSESRICQIHTQTIGLLRNYLDRHLA